MPASTMVSRSNDRTRSSAAKRRGASKADRDGDLLMDITAKTRARVGKKPGTATSSTRSKDLLNKGTNGILSSTAQRAILHHAAAGDVSTKDSRTTASRSGGLVDLKVTGWDKSKASDSQDGGVSSLIKWLEKKASLRLSSRSRDVKIKKSHVEGETLIVSVQEQDELGVRRLNGFGWAGVKLKVERVGGVNDQAPNSKTEETKAMLRSVLERRYNPDTKLLDLSALGQDEQLRSQAVFDTKSTASKFFPAMMRVLELSFDTPQERDAAVESVSLANNDLQDLDAVTTLSQTLPKLVNLDLSNNKFQKLSALSNWRRRFYHLQHLVLSNNPLEQSEPTYPSAIINWYPNLRMLNNIQVRTEEEIATKAKATQLPFPISSPNFQDEGGIAETFVRNFFAGMDTDRQALVTFYYDAKSEFSLALNTVSPRDPTGSEQNEKHEWELYIKNSRNLKKINQLPARTNRLVRGTQSIAAAYNAMPKTKHPDLASDARKWLIEAHIQPGVPDAIGNSPNGVDGFHITVHGEFDELDAAGQTKKKRSVDHVFIIGPNNAGGVRIQSHELTIRTYGGAQAFEPEDIDTWQAAATEITTTATDVAPQLPAGLTIETAEQMVVELAKQTGMNLQFSKDCLEQVAWNFPKALEAFNQVKANIPAEAFAQPAI